MSSLRTSPGRAVAIAAALWLIAAPASAWRPDPDCDELWRADRPSPPSVAEQCAEEFRRLALQYREALVELALRYPGEMVWLPGEERIERMTPAELLSMRARGRTLERLLPERERLESVILDQGVRGEAGDALARYRQLLRVEISLDMATAPRAADGIDVFRARHALSDAEPLMTVVDQVVREARDHLETSEPRKFDSTLRGFIWLARMPDGIRDSSDEEPPPRDGFQFGEPEDPVFPVPGEGGTCPVGPGPQDELPAEDDATDDGLPQRDGFRFGEPEDPVFPVPGEGGTCPGGPGPQDDLPPDDDPTDEGPPPRDGFRFGEPEDPVFPVPGEGGTCPPAPSLTPQIRLTDTGYLYSPGPIDDAPPDPVFQVVIAVIPEFRAGLAPRLRSGAPAERLSPGGGEAGRDPDDPLRIYVTSVGQLGSGAIDVTAILDDASRTVTGEVVVLEPVALAPAVAGRLEEERLRAGPEDRRVDGAGDAYCLQIDREPPPEGTWLRVAKPEVQTRYERHRRVVAAAARVRDAGGLIPDGDPESYFHSIRQWALWTLAEGLEREAFERAFVEHAKRNFSESGQAWSSQIERAVRGLVPGRWAAVQKVLSAAEQIAEQPRGGAP